VYPTYLVGPLYPLSIFPANSHYLFCVFIIAAVIKKFGCQTCDWLWNSEGTAK